MKRLFLLLFLFSLPFVLFGQISFEKGYYIDNEGNRVECSIKNVEWASNPIEFFYKLENGGEVQKATVKDVREFQVYGYPKYSSATVQIDRSTNNFDSFDWNREPVWTKETLFLKILTEGQATLYVYKENNFIRFFYSLKDREPQQLVYKIFNFDNSHRKENNMFRQQLWMNLPLDESHKTLVERVKYEWNSLVEYFSLFNNKFAYNMAENGLERADLSTQINRREGAKYFFKIKPAYTNTKLSLDGPAISDGVTLTQKGGLSIGLEFEYILPFNKNKWGLFIEPALHHFKDSAQKNNITLKADFYRVEMPFGIRHYMFMNNSFKFFADLFYTINLSGTDAEIEAVNLVKYDLYASNALGAGVGVAYKNFSIEARTLIKNVIPPRCDFQRISVVLGYNIFKR